MIIGQCPVCGADIRVGSDMTNADRIREMSDEELAKFIASGIPNEVCKRDCVDDSYPCTGCVLEWLKQEAQE